MSERGDKDYLRDIREAGRRIGEYTGLMPYEAFLEDTKTQDAVIRNLEVIGEATKNVSVELRGRYPDIPWRSMAAVRDRLIHDYFGVNHFLRAVAEPYWNRSRSTRALPLSVLRLGFIAKAAKPGDACSWPNGCVRGHLQARLWAGWLIRSGQ
jgi:uncharacterized protein with HEPN domain